RARFVARVHKTAHLFRSIDRDGYDVAHPIRLCSGCSIDEVNGKSVRSRLFPGDGCHRIACLYIVGQSQLQPEQYEVEVREQYQPLDNTALLIRALPLDRLAYLEFVSRFYCGSSIGQPDEILRRVAVEEPHML